MDIIKASGQKEKFSEEKLGRSLERAGAQPELRERVSKEVAKKIYPDMGTEKILDQTLFELQKENPVIAARYNLKRAIMELGPTGFPFERYVAKIFEEYGYDTKVGMIIRGYCVNHEVDIIARKETRHFMIECKYHNTQGARSDLKVAMYTFGRFLDIKKAMEEKSRDKIHFHQAWLVTNTKCTSQAIRYAECSGLKIISWRYPENGSLEYFIEKKGLYPITVLSSLTRYAKEKLAQKRIMLAKDLLKYSADDLVEQADIKPALAQRLKEEVNQLCFYEQP